MPYKCYGIELLYPIDATRMIGYQEYQFINDERVKTDSILLIEIGNDGFLFSDPDGAERDYWLNRIGVLSDEDFVQSAKAIEAKEERGKLHQLLDKEFKVEK